MSPLSMHPGTFEASPWDGQAFWDAPIGIAFLDEGLRYLRINKTLAAMNGLPPELHIGRSIQEVHPAIPPAVVESLEHVLATGQPIFNSVLTRWAAPRPSEAQHFLAHYYPVRNEAGALIALGTAVQDITGWRRAEMARDRSEARFRALVLATAQVVWTTDAHGELVEESPTWRAFTGQTPQQSLGSGWVDAIHPEDRTRARSAWRQAVHHRELYTVEYRLRRPDGSYTPTLARGAPVHNADGSILEWIGTNTDISASHRAREEHARLLGELQQAVRIRDEFLTVAAHELRTPLTTLGLRLQSLGNDARGWPGAQLARRALEQLEVMRRQVKRLTTLVNSLVDVTHLSEGRLQLELESVELCTVVREITVRLADEAARAGCTVKLEANCEVPGRWDRLRLEQALVHLLSNALKYGAGRPIHIHVMKGEQKARLTVRDEGIGIAPEHLPRVFDRFERGVSERHYGGLGLGLYMTRRSIEAMGGTVSVESKPGEGALFTVELPLRPPEEEGRP
ncbi:PAS domain-containing protein [Archangium violaceum]|uniref:sensor histidine kinase n=1 Tax=Archangium violaceum TaxID=83451 RepID=UPI002B2B5F9E|nr:PAS domain-containing protein [Archangium violaceum]